MARPKKSTVDYFPHDTKHGSTIQVLESRWGNDGYAFWFKLLEMLGSHENHYIDCRKPAEWELLTARTRVSYETATEIVNMLSKLDAIDCFLWTKHHVIFCIKFLGRIEDAYRKRKEKLPTLEKVYTALNIALREFPAEETPENEQTDAGSTERERESNTSTTTRAYEQLTSTFETRRSDLERLFPDINLEVAMAKLITRKGDGPLLLDPYETILKWMQTEFKPAGGSSANNKGCSNNSGLRGNSGGPGAADGKEEQLYDEETIAFCSRDWPEQDAV